MWNVPSLHPPTAFHLTVTALHISCLTATPHFEFTFNFKTTVSLTRKLFFQLPVNFGLTKAHGSWVEQTHRQTDVRRQTAIHNAVRYNGCRVKDIIHYISLATQTWLPMHVITLHVQYVTCDTLSYQLKRGKQWRQIDVIESCDVAGCWLVASSRWYSLSTNNAPGHDVSKHVT